MKRIKREGEKGAMGVGTLIVFIAMVLVAAVAASVLISTANKLQQQAQKTGDQAIREVSTSFQVIDAYGWNGEDNTIGNISLKLGLAAGSPAQSLNQTVIEVKTNESETSLLAISEETDLGDGADSNSFTFDGIIEQEGERDEFSDVQYVEQGDIVNVTLNLYQALDKEIGPQSDISIDIIPKHGTPGYVMLTTPPVINSKIVDLT